jgi:hypothetical protein
MGHGMKQLYEDEVKHSHLPVLVLPIIRIVIDICAEQALRMRVSSASMDI